MYWLPLVNSHIVISKHAISNKYIYVCTRHLLNLTHKGDWKNVSFQKKKKGPSTLAPPVTKRKSLSSLRSFPSMRSAKVNTWTQEQDMDLPLFFEDPKLKDLPPLQRVNRKKNPKLWSDILAKFGGDLKLGNDPNRLRWSESKWRNLLEELYTDKKYFDYMTSKYFYYLFLNVYLPCINKCSVV